jgi:hypothetical protein
MMRVMLYEAAQSMLRSKKWSWLKAWAMQIARRRGMKKAIVALARQTEISRLVANSPDDLCIVESSQQIAREKSNEPGVSSSVNSNSKAVGGPQPTALPSSPRCAFLGGNRGCRSSSG